MKYFKTYESFINEAKHSKVFKAAKRGSYPATIVVIKDKKVIHQEQVNTPEAIPAAFNVLQRKYPKAIITVEDKTGATLYREVDEAKNYMQKIDLKDFKAIKKGTKLLYMGGEAEVVDNNGFVLTLKQNGKKFTVNKSMFDHGGMLKEGVTEAKSLTRTDEGIMSEIDLIAKEAKDFKDFVKKFKKEYSDLTDAGDIKELEAWLKTVYSDAKNESVTEAAYVPSNIEEFAKRKGVLRDVKQIARWAEKAGKRIVGGTAIGKGYDTLVLDLRHHGGEIYYDTYKGTIKVNGNPVDSWKTFSKALEESVNEAKTYKKGDKLKIKLKNGKKFDVVFDSYSRTKGVALGKFKDRSGEYDTKPYNLDTIIESVTEAEMTKKTFLDLWKETYGENFISEYPAVAKILKNRPNNIDKREISRIWDETYGEDFKEEYPGIWDKLD